METQKSLIPKALFYYSIRWGLVSLNRWFVSRVAGWILADITTVPYLRIPLRKNRQQGQKWCLPCLRMETLKNHLPYRRSRKTFPQTSLAARSEHRRLYSQTTICSSGKRKLIPQNPGYKPRHGYRSIHMFLSSQSRLLLFKVVRQTKERRLPV